MTSCAPPSVAIRHVKEHIREAHGPQIPTGERADLQIQIGADPGVLSLSWANRFNRAD